MSYNPKQQALDETYFQGEYVYNYGGYVPEIIFETQPAPTLTPTPTQTSTSTPTPTPSASVQFDYYFAENCCSPFDTQTFKVPQGTIINQDGGFITDGGSGAYYVIGNATAPETKSYDSIVDNVCNTLICASPTPTPTKSPTPTPTLSPNTSPTPTPSITPSVSVSSSQTPTPTPTISVSPTQTPTTSQTPSPTPTKTPTPTASPLVPEPVSMTISGTGNYSSFSGTWVPSQNFNKNQYSLLDSAPTYGYLKFRTLNATTITFARQGASQILYWKYRTTAPCANVGLWQFYNTFSQHPTYPVETWIGFYKATQVQHFCASKTTINGKGWVPEGVYTTAYGTITITYNY